MMKRSWKLSVVFILLASLMLAGCGQGQDQKQGQGQGQEKNVSSPPKKEKLTIMLDWYPNAVHSFLYTAMKKGYFAAEGIDLQIQMPAETNDPLRMAAANKVDLAFTYQPEVVIARGEGVNVKSIAAVVRHPLNTVLVPAGSAIKTPKDLAGKKIGYPSIPLDEVIIDTMMKKDGADEKQMKMTDIGFDIIPAIATKRVDAVIGGYINHEQILLDKQGVPVRSIPLTKYGVPDYYELVIVTSDSTANEKKDLLRRFWKAAAKGQQEVAQNKAEGLTNLLENQKQEFPLEKDVEEKSLNILLPLMSDNESQFGSQSEQKWQEVINWLKEKKQVKGEVAAKDCFVTME
jgi:putative hydroxymethylpyrimidine transport system substrate-binding protein